MKWGGEGTESLGNTARPHLKKNKSKESKE